MWISDHVHADLVNEETLMRVLDVSHLHVMVRWHDRSAGGRVCHALAASLLRLPALSSRELSIPCWVEMQALADVLTAVRPTHDLQPVVAQHRPGKCCYLEVCSDHVGADGNRSAGWQKTSSASKGWNGPICS